MKPACKEPSRGDNESRFYLFAYKSDLELLANLKVVRVISTCASFTVEANA